MYNHVNCKNNEKAPLIADDVYEIIVEVGPIQQVGRCFPC